MPGRKHRKLEACALAWGASNNAETRHNRRVESLGLRAKGGWEKIGQKEGADGAGTVASLSFRNIGPEMQT